MEKKIIVYLTMRSTTADNAAGDGFRLLHTHIKSVTGETAPVVFFPEKAVESTEEWDQLTLKVQSKMIEGLAGRDSQSGVRPSVSFYTKQEVGGEIFVTKTGRSDVQLLLKSESFVKLYAYFGEVGTKKRARDGSIEDWQDMCEDAHEDNNECDDEDKGQSLSSAFLEKHMIQPAEDSTFYCFLCSRRLLWQKNTQALVIRHTLPVKHQKNLKRKKTISNFRNFLGGGRENLVFDL